MNEERELDVAEKKAAEPLPHDELGEVLDWDAYIPPPPPKRRARSECRSSTRAGLNRRITPNWTMSEE